MAKNKIHLCKWCDHKTDQKEEHWHHIKTHLDPKKMLACKSCPFVTEYKHHLEYHDRNHSGEKPYKCSKCTYQCVNRSMLKSHLKSHSPDCPYRCPKCTYSTKYAHSLKMHSKKYHQNKHHDRLMQDVFSSKSEESNDVSKNHTMEPEPVNTSDLMMNCILDLRIGSKLQQNPTATC